MKGGRRMSFAALVIVGDKKGQVGLGFGKAKEVPNAVEKAMKDARRRLARVSLSGLTVPHEVMGRFRSSRVVLIPASPGTGVIAGPSVRAVLECVGVQDILTKNYGSTNALNVVKATLEGLTALRARETVAKLRGVSLA
ncbi:MAG: 30S ribosomal protein S5 [Planctomycetota bacterium]